MKLKEATENACKKETLIEALSYITLIECDRAVKQALQTNGIYETCFKVYITSVIDEWNRIHS